MKKEIILSTILEVAERERIKLLADEFEVVINS